MKRMAQKEGEEEGAANEATEVEYEGEAKDFVPFLDVSFQDEEKREDVEERQDVEEALPSRKNNKRTMH